MSACSGGGSSTINASPAARADIDVLPPVVSSATPAGEATARPQVVPVELRYALPAGRTVASLASRAPQSTTRALKYIAPTNTQMTIGVTPFGGSTTTYGPTACTTGSCVVNFTATPGPNTLVFTLTDGTNTLSKFSTVTIVQPTTQNTLNFTANPVVSSVALSLASPTLSAGTEADDVLTVNARDAGGNTIVGTDGYIDVNGNPLSFGLNVANSQAGGNGTVRIKGPVRITAPGQAATSAHYDGKWLDRSTISVVASTNPSIGAQTTLVTTPTTTEYSYIQNTGAHTMTSGSPAGIVVGADGNLWATESNFPNGHCMLKISVSGSIFEYCAGITNPASIGYDVLGLDGNIWFSEYTSNKIGRITPSGAVREFPAGGNSPVGITSSSDGAIWFLYQGDSRVGRMNMLGAVNGFSLNTGFELSIIVTGPDGNMWITSKGTARIVRLTKAGVESDFTYVDSCINTDVPIVAGADGNLWFVRCDAASIGRITPSGAITPFTTGISGSVINSLTNGPDGNLWFVEASNSKIAKITMSGLVTEYPTAAVGATYGITLGSDGNLWFTNTSSANKIDKFVL